MAEVTIFPTQENAYIKTVSTESFEDGRNAVSSDSLTAMDGSRSPSSASISIFSGQYQFNRTYISFDLSSLSSDITITDIKLALSANALYDGAIITYGGDTFSKDNSNYSLYLTNLITDERNQPIPLALMNLKENILVSSSLDIVTYPPTPGKSTYGLYVVGLISNNDFRNIQLYDSGWVTYGIVPGAGASVPQPRLIITYTSGYPNIVMGIPSANISTVMGVPTANISKVMGV
jgi:hypothetical protein